MRYRRQSEIKKRSTQPVDAELPKRQVYNFHITKLEIADILPIFQRLFARPTISVRLQFSSTQ
jgi:hypothetical protein